MFKLSENKKFVIGENISPSIRFAIRIDEIMGIGFANFGTQSQFVIRTKTNEVDKFEMRGDCTYAEYLELFDIICNN